MIYDIEKLKNENPNLGLYEIMVSLNPDNRTLDFSYSLIKRLKEHEKQKVKE